MTARIRQRGHSSVEFVVIFLLFAAVITGLLEMTRIFRAKYVLAAATFQAARAGSLHHARLGTMDAELANGMAQIYMDADRSPAGLAAALIKARTVQAVPGVGVTIVSPTQEIFDKLKKSQWLRLNGDADYGWHKVIPNDNLRWRPREPQSIKVSGKTAQINLPDANLLRIRSLWCYRLVVPALDRLIFDIVNTPMFVTQRQLICTAMSGAANLTGVAGGYYLAISSNAIVRMQSAVVSDDLP